MNYFLPQTRSESFKLAHPAAHLTDVMFERPQYKSGSRIDFVTSGVSWGLGDPQGWFRRNKTESVASLPSATIRAINLCSRNKKNYI